MSGPPLANAQPGTTGELDPDDTEEMRQAVAELLPDAKPVIVNRLVKMLAATKKARLQRHCPKCRCNHIEFVDIDDSVNALAALRLTLEYGKGKPRQMDATEHGPSVVITRTVRPPQDAEKPAEAGLTANGTNGG